MGKNTSLTPAEIGYISNRNEDIKKRLSKITKGPWRIRKGCVDEDAQFIEAPKEKPTDPYNIEILGEDTTLYSTWKEDQEFIVNAPNDIQYLLNILEKQIVSNDVLEYCSVCDEWLSQSHKCK